jgi:hypothetical protein
VSNISKADHAREQIKWTMVLDLREGDGPESVSDDGLRLPIFNSCAEN